MGKLYCCCKEASKKVCESCKKGLVVKPEHIVMVPSWSRRPLTGKKVD